MFRYTVRTLNMFFYLFRDFDQEFIFSAGFKLNGGQIASLLEEKLFKFLFQVEFFSCPIPKPRDFRFYFQIFDETFPA